MKEEERGGEKEGKSLGRGAAYLNFISWHFKCKKGGEINYSTLTAGTREN